jgi:excinuclease ABC subunit C
MSHTSVIEAPKTKSDEWLKTEQILKRLLGLEKVSRIECYDISNIQGNQATGSMVVFTNGSANKNEYKKFRIKMENKPNDIAMLKEVLQRRFAHSEWTYPEVILIDGGKAQLNAGINSKSEARNPKQIQNIKVISIAKKNKDLYIEGRDGFIPLKTLPREIYNLVLQLDDEAHRFAISYHKKLRKKNLLV